MGYTPCYATPMGNHTTTTKGHTMPSTTVHTLHTGTVALHTLKVGAGFRVEGGSTTATYLGSNPTTRNPRPRHYAHNGLRTVTMDGDTRVTPTGQMAAPSWLAMHDEPWRYGGV